MAKRRYLIVNADDFGQSQGVNQGIIQAFERGIVTSASLMVRWPAAEMAAKYAREHLTLSVGLHVDLGEWAYREGQWTPVYSVVDECDAVAVAAEVSRQLAQFYTLVGRNPTHLDSHQHVHRDEPARSILIQAGQTLGIPLRHFSKVHYCGDFYGQMGNGEPYPEGVTTERLMQTMLSLPEGVTEIGCHPGLGDDVDSMYRTERAEELKTLCNPRVRECLATLGVELFSFQDLGRQKLDLSASE